MRSGVTYFDHLGGLLSLVRWDLFLTLTFSSVPCPRKGWLGAWQLCRYCSEVVKVPYSDLLLGFRSELGGVGGRWHLHGLIGGTRCGNLTTLSHVLEAWWRKRHGIADIRPMDNALGAVSYTVKSQGGARWSGRDAYEVGRFDGRADELRVSASVGRVLRRLVPILDSGVLAAGVNCAAGGPGLSQRV